MQNINNLVSDLQKYYNEKYNGKKFPNGYIAGLVASNGFEYVEGRYLLIDGEKVRLDSFCREHKITCNYTSTVNHSTNGETHVITAKLNGKSRKTKAKKTTSKRALLRSIIEQTNNEQTRQNAFKTLFKMQRSQREKLAFEAKQAAKAAKQAALQAYEAKLKSMKKDTLLKLLMEQKAVAL